MSTFTRVAPAVWQQWTSSNLSGLRRTGLGSQFGQGVDTQFEDESLTDCPQQQQQQQSRAVWMEDKSQMLNEVCENALTFQVAYMYVG